MFLVVEYLIAIVNGYALKQRSYRSTLHVLVYHPGAYMTISYHFMIYVHFYRKVVTSMLAISQAA